MGQEETPTQRIDSFIEKIHHRAQNARALNLTEWFSWLTFDFFGNVALGMDFGCVQNADNHPWVQILQNWFRATAFAANANAFGILAPLIMMFANIKDLMGIKIHLQKSAEKVRERVERGATSGKADIWT